MDKRVNQNYNTYIKYNVIHLSWVSVAHDIIKCTLGTLVNTLYTVPVIHEVLSAYTRICRITQKKKQKHVIIKVHIEDQCNKTNYG